MRSAGVAPGSRWPGCRCFTPSSVSYDQDAGEPESSLAGTMREPVVGWRRLRHSSSAAAGVSGLTLIKTGMPGKPPDFSTCVASAGVRRRKPLMLELTRA